MNGAITMSELEKMPVKKYAVLKRAVDLEQYDCRLRNVYDSNRAFHDAEPLFKKLNEEYEKLCKKPLFRSEQESSGNVPGFVNWDSDYSGIETLKQYQK
jgi:hypothetical protein